MPTVSMASERLLSFGEFHLAALGETPEQTGSLIEVFRPTHDALAAASAARVTAERATIGPRVALGFSERRLETVIRQMFRTAQGLDGKAGRTIQKALFPNGLTAETKPRGASQKTKAEELLRRVQTLTVAEPLRAQFVPALEAGIADLDARLTARATAMDAFGIAFAREIAARHDFVRAYAVSAGAIRSTFPNDRETQDLYFDTVHARRRSDDDSEGGDEGGDGG